ncbi:MAG: hydrogenase maturation protease [Candidatus Eisenbacteria bacterium]|nr:hydrogenase maturation protease [Candidatus Eisenbacteria bacterium]
MKTLIVGLAGKRESGADVGFAVARGVHSLLRDPRVDILETTTYGLDLFGLAAGYDKVVVVDCVDSGDGDVGELRRLGLSDLELEHAEDAGRDAEYRARVMVEKGQGSWLPDEISIYAIEVARGGAPEEERAAVREAVPRLVAQIIREEFGSHLHESEWM